MTIESAKAYLERMKNDENFRKECSEKSSPEELIKFVKASGFDFSMEDIDQVKSELSDDEMEMIAGGTNGTYIKISTTDRLNIPQ
ncbi:MAG: Nif11-like leader peptide family natural product precursor [bacterium]|nr:Nif11-like leader peptide family natural product precursor [bacterium]